MKRLGSLASLSFLRGAAAALAFSVAGLHAAEATTVGVSTRSVDIFLQALLDAVKARAGESGAEVDIANAAGDPDRQIAQVRDLIAKKVDALIVIPASQTQATTMTGLAAQANIPIVFLNLMPKEKRFDSPVALVVSNDLVAGRLQMRLIADRLKGSGNVVIIRGENTHPAAIGRRSGIEEVLGVTPGIKVVGDESANWDRAQAETMISGMLARGVKFDAIAAGNDEMALGAISALNKAGIAPDTVVVAGVDGTPAGLEAMKAGTLDFTILQNAAAQGARAAEDAVAMTSGKFVPQFDWVPYDLILPSNLAAYSK